MLQKYVYWLLNISAILQVSNKTSNFKNWSLLSNKKNLKTCNTFVPNKYDTGSIPHKKKIWHVALTKYKILDNLNEKKTNKNNPAMIE